jgi:hypothetical protein
MCCDLFEEIIDGLLPDKKIDSFARVRLYFIYLMEYQRSERYLCTVSGYSIVLCRHVRI